MKFHVGDRWADQFHGEWWVYDASDAWAHAIDSDGDSYLFSQETGERRDNIIGGERRRLTRLISSERWIPFTERMPDEPENSDSYVLLGAPQYPHYETAKIYAVEGIRQNNEAAGRSFTHWRYLTPPEAS